MTLEWVEQGRNARNLFVDGVNKRTLIRSGRSGWSIWDIGDGSAKMMPHSAANLREAKALAEKDILSPLKSGDCFQRIFKIRPVRNT